ncbi:MAG TPA: Sec-dependent nitrous-oxide reductase [Flavobacteriaceae bacterium]|nr:Sec-dependent nitrous-oxide reductase [Flavobacteriaceae bacterium]
MMRQIFKLFGIAIAISAIVSCQPGGANGKSSSSSKKSAAEKAYVAPGEYDEYYGFLSGGFSGQVYTYGFPSARLLKIIPVFSQDPQSGYGYSEETKPMLQTSYGFIPWDDLHHPDISQTNGELDGRWIFANGNNTPRIARIDLQDFETQEIIEIPNSAGNHNSAFVTENTEYVVAGTRFGVPIPQKDMPIKDYKGNFKASMTFLSVDEDSGEMDIAFQIRLPGYNYDLAHPGRDKSHGWMFFTTYNTEEAHTLLEVNASKFDKDFITAINWKKAEEYVKEGKGTIEKTRYAHNKYDSQTHTATTEWKDEVLVLDPTELPGIVYFVPSAKSPHGVDVDPTGEYIVSNGKLSANLVVHSFSKIKEAVDNEEFVDEAYGIPILDFDNTLAGIVEQPGIGPLHTEFDERGNAYSTFFISSEIVKWDVKTQEVLDRIDVYYSPGHLSIPGGNSRKPDGKYLLSMNKITKDRYLPVGPEMNQPGQLIDISGDKMEMILDFPMIGEPHYASMIHADKIKDKSRKIYRLASENDHPMVVKSGKDVDITRDGKNVHVKMGMIRSHFNPDNIEGIKVGDKVHFHLTNTEQDFDIPHGFAVMGANNSEILVVPGQTKTLTWEPKEPGIYPFYCTDFCSALHQEMQGYIRVSPEDSDIELSWSLNKNIDG